jgi:thiamine biosynthesis lipoprotein
MRALAAATAAALALALASTPSARAESKESRDPNHEIKRSDGVMGTIVNITIWHDDDKAAATAIADVFTELERLDALMTSWTDDSAVAKISAASGTKRAVEVDEETFAVIEKAQAIAKQTGGAFDITVGAFHNLWKFGSNQDGSIPSDADVAERVKLVGYKRVKLDAKKRTIRLAKKGMAITLGGIAKGYAVDRAVKILHDAGFVDFIIQAGGDLYVSGRKGSRSWIVGIRDPRGKRTTPFAITPIENKTFSTSGDYERAIVKNGVRYHHILDPKTGRPVAHTRSVTVMANDAITADGWSTALFVMGAEKGMPVVEKLEDVEAVFVDSDNKVHVSSGLEKSLRILSPPSDGI